MAGETSAHFLSPTPVHLDSKSEQNSNKVASRPSSETTPRPPNVSGAR